MPSKKTKKAEPKSQALTLVETQLTPHQLSVLYQPTPAQFIKERQGRGGKTVKYLEAGYFIARLNEAFSPVGWSFEVKKIEVSEKEVTVVGTLTIIDHKNGYRVTKEQCGGHEREAKVPLGDTMKAATSDSLKKCCSMLGIGLDVYWRADELLTARGAKEVKNEGKVSKAEAIANLEANISKCQSISLLQEWNENVLGAKKLNEEERNKLSAKINLRIDQLLNASGK